MQKILLVILSSFLVVMGAGAIYFKKINPPSSLPGDEVTACTMEAKMCPDGSYVGRTGPQCQFAPCPPIAATSTGPTTGTTTVDSLNHPVHLNEKITVGGITITPLEIIGDSRCPVDVQCIQAGTVTLKIQVEKGEAKEIKIVTLEKSTIFTDSRVTLKSVAPVTNSKKTIAAKDYQFMFLVVKEIIYE